MNFLKITFDYKFFVFQLQNIWIQQKKVILNHSFQFENFSKKKMLSWNSSHFQHFALEISQKFQHLHLKKIYMKSDSSFFFPPPWQDFAILSKKN